MKSLLLIIAVSFPLIAMQDQSITAYTGILMTKRDFTQQEIDCCITLKALSSYAGAIPLNSRCFLALNKPVIAIKESFIQDKLITNTDTLHLLYLKDKKLSIVDIQETTFLKDIYDQYGNPFFISESVLQLMHQYPQDKKKLYNVMWRMCCDTMKINAKQ